MLSWKSVAALAFCLVLGSVSASGELRGLPANGFRVTKDTSSVTCFHKEFRSDSTRSPALVSPDGRYRAYVEVSAFATASKGEGEKDWPVCTNRSTLFVAGPGENGFKTAFERWARPRYGNSLKLVDWSSDSRYLLAEWNEWKYETDSYGTFVFIYDVVSNHVTIPNQYLAFNKLFAALCAPDLKVVGYRRVDGRVVLEASPNEMEDVCIEKRGFWLFDQWKNWVRPLSRWPPMQRNASWEGAD